MNCSEKQEYIQRIMSMEESVQHVVMTAIQEVMVRMVVGVGVTSEMFVLNYVSCFMVGRHTILLGLSVHPSIHLSACRSSLNNVCSIKLKNVQYIFMKLNAKIRHHQMTCRI